MPEYVRISLVCLFHPVAILYSHIHTETFQRNNVSKTPNCNHFNSCIKTVPHKFKNFPQYFRLPGECIYCHYI